ncbi:iron ABC transporter permease [Leucobacter sp. OH1287]|uniref:FecCD family ABC transporter permease n=1 Tax=Leucobacter sp. OH1287 TaxID=2491049 RepID=UPI000F5ED89B|nr:iron ABC transporter permease [Leucobacter sp. OH1287]RRD59577.1 iron ABC transporter permease [Leucobacter sp. OH1287]
MKSKSLPPELQLKRAGRTTLVAIILSVLLLAAVLFSAGIGQLQIPASEVAGSLLHRVGIDWLPLPSHPTGDQTLWSLRFPRVVMAALVGAALALSGLLMQAIFGNPLAEPGVVGVSSGAALGAGVGIVLGITIFGTWTTPIFAFIGGLIATLTVYFVSRSGGKTEVVTLVLTGIAVNAVGGAGIALLTFIGDTSSREQIIFWQLGTIAGTRWVQVGIVVPLLILGIIASLSVARSLDLLSLGERNARHLGVNVELLRIGIIVLVALLVGVAVAFTGIIAFVGLVVPHLMRMIMGPAHRPLMVTSLLGGALLLTLADLGARTIVPMADLPIGLLTSLIGGPFFFWLLRKTRKHAGGWS